MQKKNNLKLCQFTHFTNPCNFTHFDNFHAILTVNSPVWGSKPTCTVCSKLEGLEMIGFSFSFNFLEFEPASKTEHLIIQIATGKLRSPCYNERSKSISVLKFNTSSYTPRKNPHWLCNSISFTRDFLHNLVIATRFLHMQYAGSASVWYGFAAVYMIHQ